MCDGIDEGQNMANMLAEHHGTHLDENVFNRRLLILNQSECKANTTAWTEINKQKRGRV